MENVFDLIAVQHPMLVENAKREIRACNTVSEQYGLRLTEEDISELVECREAALKDTGRIEFAGGVVPKLVDAFCDSPYVMQENFKDVLANLQELFYYFKNESNERLSDDTIIERMVKVFNNRAQGSVEFMCGLSLRELSIYAAAEDDPFNTFGSRSQAGDME